MTELLDLSYSEVVTLVNFTWGPVEDPEQFGAFYVDVEEDPILLGKRYIGRPTMAVDIPDLSAGLDIGVATVTLPWESETFADYISSGFGHAPVYCVIAELHSRPSPQNPTTAPGVEMRQNSLVYLFSGPVVEATKNSRGHTNQVTLKIATPMVELDHKQLGLPANAECAHTFLGQGCFLDLSDATHPLYPMFEDTSIVAISGNVVTMHPNSSRVHTMPDPGWIHGYVDVEGLRIKIVDAARYSYDVTLIDPPPPRWLNSNCRIVAGCGLTLGDCEFFHNGKNFGAYGWAIPAFNPLFEAQ